MWSCRIPFKLRMFIINNTAYRPPDTILLLVAYCYIIAIPNLEMLSLDKYHVTYTKMAYANF